MRTRLGLSIVVAFGSLAGCGAGPFSALDDAGGSGSETSAGSTGEVTDDSTADTDAAADTNSTGPLHPEDVSDGGPLTCDPWVQDCPAAEKCVAYALPDFHGYWDANTCVAVTGTQTAGQACYYDGPDKGSDDCDAASGCWNAQPVDGDLIGTCFAFCSGSPDDPSCPDPLTTCRTGNDESIALCLPSCDPLLQACDSGLGCYWSQTSGDFHCVGTSGPGITTGEPCGYNNDCSPGSFCADADAVGGCLGSQCCASFCSLAQDPSPCTDGSTCIPFFADGTAPAIYADLGLCVVSFADPLNQPDAW